MPPLPSGGGRTRARRAADHLRHVDRGRAAGRGGLRQGLARGARDRRRRRIASTSCRCSSPHRSGREGGPTLVFHGHLDVVPGASGAVHAARRGRPADRPRRLRHEGRPRGDDVRAPRPRRAGPPCACASCCVPDEESEDIDGARPTSSSARGYVGDFAITGEPTDLHVGVQAKGVLAIRLDVHGRAAHGSTPWLGDNAVLKAIDVFRRIESMPFSRESSELFDRPSINLGRIDGRRRAQQGPRPLRDGRRHPLPAQPGPRRHPRADPRDPGHRGRARRSSARPRTSRARTRTCVALCDVVAAHGERRVDERRPRRRLRRDLVPRGRRPGGRVRPAGAGHHGPEEWVSISSLAPLPPGARGLRARAVRPGLAEGASAAAAARSRAGSRDAGRRRAPAAGRPRARLARAARRRAGDRARDARRAVAADRAAAGRRRRRPIRQPGPGRTIEHPARSTTPTPAAPQTLMILGSDQRYGDDRKPAQAALGHDPARSADPDTRGDHGACRSRATCKVDIPGHGSRQDQRRATSSAAQRGLTRRSTVKKLLEDTTARTFPINHVIVTSTSAASGARSTTSAASTSTSTATTSTTTRRRRAATRRSTSTPATRSSCGKDALDYVRYRHTDNDLVRAARQQDFLRQAQGRSGRAAAAVRRSRREAPAAAGRSPLLRASTSRCARTSRCCRCSSSRSSWRARTRGPRGPVPGADDAPNPQLDSNLYAEQSDLKTVDRQFMSLEGSAAPSKGPIEADADRRRRRKPREAAQEQGHGRAGARGRADRGRGPGHPRRPASSTSRSTSRRSRATGVELRRHRAAARRTRSATRPARSTQAYRLVAARPGTPASTTASRALTWKAPPILDDPHATVTRNGRKLRALLRRQHGCGSWPGRPSKAVYWVSNTLTHGAQRAPDARDRRARCKRLKQYGR